MEGHVFVVSNKRDLGIHHVSCFFSFSVSGQKQALGPQTLEGPKDPQADILVFNSMKNTIELNFKYISQL